MQQLGREADVEHLTGLSARAAEALPDLHRHRAITAIHKWIAIMPKAVGDG